MKRLAYRILAALHGLIVRQCLVFNADSHGYQLHNMCGKWMGAAQLNGYRIDQESRKSVPLDTPVWVAFVFLPEGAETVTEEGFANLADATVALHRLARKHFGRRLLVPREWWASK